MSCQIKCAIYFFVQLVYFSTSTDTRKSSPLLSTAMLLGESTVFRMFPLRDSFDVRSFLLPDLSLFSYSIRFFFLLPPRSTCRKASYLFVPVKPTPGFRLTNLGNCDLDVFLVDTTQTNPSMATMSCVFSEFFFHSSPFASRRFFFLAFPPTYMASFLHSDPGLFERGVTFFLLYVIACVFSFPFLRMED